MYVREVRLMATVIFVKYEHPILAVRGVYTFVSKGWRGV